MIKHGILFLLKAYKSFVSPFLGTHCRFYPSCSSYFYQAVDAYGAAGGTKLGLRRLLKCHPFHAGGIDDVPK